MKQTICDYCGRGVNFPTNREITGDLDTSNLAVIEVRPRLLNQTHRKIVNPDLCIECIIKVLKSIKRIVNGRLLKKSSSTI